MGLRSPFYCKYLEHQAVIVPFEEIGWDMVIQFGDIKDEVRMIRERAGFVDYSFNNLVTVVGPDAFRFLQKIIVNDLNKIKPGRGLYTSLVNDDGNIVDDATVFWLGKDHFLYNGLFPKEVVNAWLEKYEVGFDVKLIPMGLCLLSVQGPKSREIFKKHIDIEDLSFYDIKKARINGTPVFVNRMGYSGELGYELYFLPEYASTMWDFLLEIGKEHGLGPYGIGATEVLSLEKGFLSPFDYYPGSSPLELGLGWTVAFNKGEFIGREALLQRKKEGIKTKLVAFEIKDAGFELDHFAPVMKNGKKVGEVTDFAPGFTVGKALLARAFVDIDVAKEGEAIEVEHGGKKASAKITLQKDWYDPGNKKLKG